MIDEELEPAARRRDSRVVPASPVQRYRYFLHHSTSVCGISRCYRLPPMADDTAVLGAVEGLVVQHAALRTRFLLDDGQIVQVIDAKVRPQWRVVHAADGPMERHLIAEEAARPFDLETGPLFRAALIRRTGVEPLLVLTAHPIVADRRSFDFLGDELAKNYSTLAGGEVIHPVGKPGDYADFRFPDDDVDGDWAQSLAGPPPALRLPADRQHDRQSVGIEDLHRFDLPVPAVESLDVLCRSAGGSVFTGLLAAFSVLLSRYTDLTDILIGIPVANRDVSGAEQVIGPFENTLLIRCDLTGAPSFRDLLGSIGSAVAQARLQRHVPLERIVREAMPQEGSEVTLASFAESGSSPSAWDVPGGRIVESPVASAGSAGAAVVEIGLEIQPAGQGVFRYRSDLFERATVERLAGHYGELLRSIARDPDVPVSALVMLGECEHERLAPPPARTPQAEMVCCHELFAEQARLRPDAVAVVCGSATLTYRELDERGNQLAHHLRELGVRAEVLVGLSMARSVELIVAILGIMKAGGAYVPLDPSYPQARLRHIIEDAGIGHVVRTDGTDLPGEFRGRVIDLAADAASISARPTHTPERVVTVDSLAYVIYTSGSTGRPKGTLIPHRNIVRLFDSTRHWFGFDEDDVWTLFHSYAFDFSVWEIWGALVHGGTLVVVPFEVSRSPEDFLRLLRDSQVTVLNQTPSAFYQLMRAEQADGGPLALRYVIFGGEALEPAALRPWLLRHGDERPRLVNMYGITETTVHVTYRPLGLADTATGKRSPIGVPIPDLQLYVLDQHLQPVPEGVPGELFVGGAGLARGYLNRPELTAERFIPHPFGDADRDRLYRTGDRVRLLPDGDLEYCGRVDQQVKLRGFRIELGEIEAVLAESAQVGEAVVMLKTDSLGVDYLAGYLVCTGEFDESALRAELAGRLPDYFIPASFVVLDRFPLTVNGKVDRARLPEPVSTRSASDFVEGRDRVERTLAKAWAEVLGKERAGIDDNFFASGGDSIRSIQILAKAREHGLDFDLPDLLRVQTIRRLAPLVRVTESMAPERPEEPFALLDPRDRAKVPDGVVDAFPLTSLQAGMLYQSELTAGANGGQLYHNVTSYHLRGRYSEPAWRAAVADVLARHEILRTSFDFDTFRVPVQLVHARVPEPISFEDISQLTEEEQEVAVERRFEAERHRPLDRGVAPLLRFHLQRRSESSWQLFVAEHHAILDGWSERSMMAELFDRYRAGITQRPPADPPGSRFRSYVEAERAAQISQDERRFWSEELAEASCTAVAGWRPAAGPAVMAHTEVPVAESLSRKVSDLADLLGVSVRTVLLATHVHVLGVLGGTDDVLTGVVSNGRMEEPDGDKVLGVFLNTLPFRARLSGGTWLDLISAIAEQDWRVQEHRRYPMADIQAQSGISPLFETFFNYTNFHVHPSGNRHEGLEDLEVLGEEWVANSEFPFGVEFSLDEAAGRLIMALRFDSARFDARQIELIGGYYLAALRAMAESPESSYLDENLLSEEELGWHAVWNDTARDFPDEHVLHRLIEQQAARTPDAPAVRFDGAVLTYRELDESAGRLAHRLRELKIARGDFVALYLDRSIELMVGLLAVLKAGAAYVPVSRADPGPRVRDLLANAGVSLVLTTTEGAQALPDVGVAVEPVDGTLNEYPVLDAPADSTPDDPAYMIFTSGSTGRPKGVVVSHRAISNRLLWMQDEYRLATGEPVLQKTPTTFDVSVWELFWPLLVGATVVLARPDGHRDPAYLAGVIRERRITTIHFVPSMLRAFLDYLQTADVGACATLTRVFCSGEALTPDLQERCFSLLSAGLVNLYGPTEAAVDVTYWQCRDGDDVVPIGRPIANIETHVLDRHGRPVPVGVAGELHLGGVGLADGYHNQPDLTAARFVFHTRPDGTRVRLYKTGDLARRTPDGVLHYLGRIDNQVKVRGMRVELGEIEAVLGACETVRECAVLMDGERLTAYVAPANSGELDSAGCVAFLRQRLPEHMIPSAWRRVERLPLTTSGKVARKALASMSVPVPTAETILPRDETELRLASVWSEVFPGSLIGVHDHFFDLGGNSISALGLQTRIRKEFGVELPLSALLGSSTVAEQASSLRHGGAPSDGGGSLVSLRGGDGTPLFVVHPVGGSLFCYYPLLSALPADQPVSGFAAQGFEPGQEPLPSVAAMAERYVAELISAWPRGPYHLLGWSMGGVIAFEMAALLRYAGHRVELLALLDSGYPVDEPRPVDETEVMASFVDDLYHSVGRERTKPGVVDHSAVLDELRADQVFPDVDPARFERCFSVFRANVRALESVRLPDYSGPLVYFHGDDEAGAARAQSWLASTSGESSAVAVPGDHYQLMRDPGIGKIAGALNVLLGHRIRKA